jgi:hypothetical protein
LPIAFSHVIDRHDGIAHFCLPRAQHIRLGGASTRHHSVVGQHAANYELYIHSYSRRKVYLDLGPGVEWRFRVRKGLSGYDYDTTVAKRLELTYLAGSPDLVVNYTANFGVGGNAYLALYGWSYGLVPTREFYVVEAFGNHNPSDNVNQSFYGYHTSDGAEYELWSKINGDLRQYWSVRRTKRHGYARHRALNIVKLPTEPRLVAPSLSETTTMPGLLLACLSVASRISFSRYV